MSGPVAVSAPVGVLAPDAPVHQSDVVSGVSGVPPGFPARLNSKLAWIGQDVADPQQYVYELTAADRHEISQAVAHFKTLELDGEHVSRATFPLPVLGATLDALSRDVHSGRGFCLVRGVRPTDYAVQDLMLVYLGVQSYIAEQRARQDSRGNMLVHIVADASSRTAAEHHRHSTKAITFHTEETGDVVGWLTRSTAAEGGRCVLASAYTVYNVLAATRPDLLRLLTRSDWPFAFPTFQCRPIFFCADEKEGRVICNFGRTPLLGNAIHARPQRLPACSPQQVEALDAVEAIARATEVEIATQPGDMHFINNLALLHRRAGFQEAGEKKRHLVRMRLRSSSSSSSSSNPQTAWTLPRELQADWAAAFDDDAGRRVWHIEPMPEAFFPLRKYPN